MDFLSGLVRGFTESRRADELRARDEADRQRQLESKMLGLLVGPEVDPEIQSAALTAMLTPPAKRGRGLFGFLQETQASPAYKSVLGMLQPQTRETIPAKPILQPGGAALPQGGAVEPGAAPLNRGVMGAPAQGPPELSGARELLARQDLVQPPLGPGTAFAKSPEFQSGSYTYQRPIYRSPEDTARAEAYGRTAGTLRATAEEYERAGPEARRIIAGRSGVPQRVTPGQAFMITYVDEDGEETTGAGTYDPASGRYMVNGQAVTPLKITKAASGSGSLRYITDNDGTVRVYSGVEQVGNLGGVGKPQLPPPAYAGTFVGEGGAVTPIMRGGGTGTPLGTARETGVTTDQALAKGVIAAADKAAAADAKVYSQKPLDEYVKAANQQYGKNWTYTEWKAQAETGQAIGGGGGAMGRPKPPPVSGAAPKTGVGRPKAPADSSDPEGLGRFLKRPGG